MDGIGSGSSSSIGSIGSSAPAAPAPKSEPAPAPASSAPSTRDSTSISSDARSSDRGSTPSVVRGLGDNFGSITPADRSNTTPPKVTYGWGGPEVGAGKPPTVASPGRDTSLDGMASVGESAINRYNQFKSDYNDKGIKAAVGNLSSDATNLVKDTINEPIKGLEKKLDELPMGSGKVPAAAVGVGRGLLNSAISTPDAIAQVALHPVDTMKNIGNAVMNPSSIADAYNARAEKYGGWAAAGETLGDVASLGRGLSGFTKEAAETAKLGRAGSTLGTAWSARSTYKEGLHAVGEPANTVSELNRPEQH